MLWSVTMSLSRRTNNHVRLNGPGPNGWARSVFSAAKTRSDIDTPVDNKWMLDGQTVLPVTVNAAFI
jgi:hypothetical protein